MGVQRTDDFETRRQHLANMSEEDLEKYFWELSHQVVSPLIELARTHTTPSIERSVLLRMGLDSLTANGIAEQALNKGLLGHGAGHCVWRYAKIKELTVAQAGAELAQGRGWDELALFFGEGLK